MGLFDRLRRLIRASVNDTIRRHEDPEKVLNEILLDMNKQLVEAKRNVATAIAEEKRLERQVVAQEEKAQEWERRAVVALKAGKEDLAREALIRKKREDDYARQFRAQYDKQHEAVEGLKVALRGLQDKMEDAQRQKNLLVARAKRAEAQKRIQEVITGLDDTSAFQAFDDMAARVEQLEAESEAIGELDVVSTDKSLEEEIAALEEDSTDAMLDDLRRKVALDSATGGANAGAGDRAAGTDHGGEGATDIDTSLEELKRRMREATE